MTLAAVFGACMAAAAAVVLLCRWWAPGAAARRKTHWHYQQLAAANGLTAAEAKALWRIARAAQLADPTLVFVRPSLLDSCAAPARVPAEAVHSLRGKLFGS